MGSEVPAAPVVDKVSMLAATSPGRSHPSKKNKGKVPKRINKAEREKMKREHLNDLFLALANAVDLDEQNNGKASILGETARIVKDMLAQIECLKRENASLVSESEYFHVMSVETGEPQSSLTAEPILLEITEGAYVTIEKNELQDENSALQDQIGKLQNVLKERMAQSKLDLNITPMDSQDSESTSYFSDDRLRLPSVEPALQQAPIMNPVFVIPVCPDIQVYPDPDSAKLATKPISNVSKPHARYPTLADSWPSKLLEKQSEAGKELQRCDSNSS